jgi:AcrR family transcriptional regulator
VARETEVSDQSGARERILAAASDLFLTEGILGSGVDRLVEASDVAKATFYRHFPSKDDVIVAWLRRPEARWIESVLARLDREHHSPLERLLSFWSAIDAWERPRGYPGCPFLNTLVEIRDRDHPARALIASFIAEVDGFFIENARDVGGSGRGRRAAPDARDGNVHGHAAPAFEPAGQARPRSGRLVARTTARNDTGGPRGRHRLSTAQPRQAISGSRRTLCRSCGRGGRR